MYGGGWAADWRSESIRITDLHFADDRVRMAVTTEVLAEALESLSEEAEPLGLRGFWIKTKVQAFQVSR